MSTTKPNEAASSPEKVGELTGESKKSVRLLIVKMALFVAVPPLMTGIVEALTGWQFPPWLRDSLYMLILTVESMIFYWTTKMAAMMIAAENAYAEILALAEKVKTPLENIGKLLYGMSDLLPTIEKIFASIPKEKARETLERVAKELERESMKPQDIASAAQRLSKAVVVKNDVGAPRP